MSNAPAAALERAKRVRLMVFDVDGVLTDGKLWYGPQGETLKAFYVRDGMGLRLLAESGIALALLTSRRSEAVALRAAELRIEHVLQGAESKHALFAALLGAAPLRIRLRAGRRARGSAATRALRDARGSGCGSGARGLRARPARAGQARGGARRIPRVTFSTTRLFPLLLMLALALVTFWLERTVREEPSHPSLRRHDPDYLVEQFVVTKYNAAGVLESTISAAKMIHYPDDDSTELVAPRVVQAKANEPRMTLSADRGAISQNGEELFLFGNALLVREAGGGRSEARMRSSFLHVIGARSLVRTDREVEIAEQGRTISGRGMEYHNETWQLFLRNQVRGRFEPAKKKPPATR
jgi:lipopolysaccharide export system protein LptC